MPWMEEQSCSIAFTTYQAGKLFLMGRKTGGGYSAFERTFPRCMGVWSNGQSIWVSSLYQIWRLENVLRPGEIVDGFDRLYVPQVGYTTGDVDVHDVALDADGKPVFVNTLFSCLATVSETHSFVPLWMPPFVSKLAAEDRCHLNGIAMQNGQPKYATCCGQTDAAGAWREHRSSGGCVVDVATNQIICEGLSMPHSPRMAGDKLWLLESGSGFFGYVDAATGGFERVAFCSGYARGLAFVNEYAVIGLSKCRRDRTFGGLPLDKNLVERNAAARTALLIVDTRSGDVIHWIEIQGVIDELYDVAVLPHVVRPKAIGFKTREIASLVSINHGRGSERWTTVDE